MSTPTLHVVSAEEADLVDMRLKALRLFAARYADNLLTQSTMIGALRRLARIYSDGRCDEQTFPWEHVLDIVIVEQMRELAVTHFASATASRDMAALRAMLDCCRKAKLITHDQLKELLEFKGVTPRSKPGRLLTLEHIESLLRDCLSDPNAVKGIRDAAIIATLASSGVRRQELAAIRLDAVELDRNRIVLTHTKGGQPRPAFLNSAAVGALREWLGLRGEEGAALFTWVSRSGRIITERPISDHSVWKMVRDRSLAAGLPEGTATHDLRRFTVTQLLTNGIDLLLVMKVIGHKSPSTTAKYDRRDEVMCRAAVEDLAIPTLSDLRASSVQLPSMVAQRAG